MILRYKYLASPYTHPDSAVRSERYLKAMDVVARLSRIHIPVYSPIVHFHMVAVHHDLPHDWDFWRRVALPMLLPASELLILCLPGWQASKGIMAEKEFAAEQQIPVTYMDPLP